MIIYVDECIPSKIIPELKLLGFKTIEPVKKSRDTTIVMHLYNMKSKRKLLVTADNNLSKLCNILKIPNVFIEHHKVQGNIKLILTEILNKVINMVNNE